MKEGKQITVYGIEEDFNGKLSIEKAEGTQRKSTVVFERRERIFGWRKLVSLSEVHTSPEAAVAAHLKKLEDVVQSLRERLAAAEAEKEACAKLKVPRE